MPEGRTESNCPSIEALACAETDAAVARAIWKPGGHCRTELALLREFEAATPRATEMADVKWIEAELARRQPSFVATGPVGHRGFREYLAGLFAPRRRFALALACAALVAVVLGGGLLRRNPEKALSQPGETAWRSAQFTVLAPAGDVTRPPGNFEWEPAPGAAQYVVELRGVDGALLWSATSASVSIAPPPDIRALFVGGRAFRWSVTARNAAGNQIAASNLQIFHILATPR